MISPIQASLKSLGVTPWQLILGVACIGSWWATVQPLPGKLEQLNSTVQALATRVEVQSVLLNSVKELHGAVKENREESRVELNKLREEITRLYSHLTASKALKPTDIFDKLNPPNELSPLKPSNQP